MSKSWEFLRKWPKCRNSENSWENGQNAEIALKSRKPGTRTHTTVHHTGPAPWPRTHTTGTTHRSAARHCYTECSPQPSHGPTAVHQASFGYSPRPIIPTCLKPPLFWTLFGPVKTGNFPIFDRRRVRKFTKMSFLAFLTVFGQFWSFLGPLQDTSGFSCFFYVSKCQVFPRTSSKSINY